MAHEYIGFSNFGKTDTFFNNEAALIPKPSVPITVFQSLW